MCATCGCEHGMNITLDGVPVHVQDDKFHSHEREIQMERESLHRNNIIANHLRDYFEKRNIYVVNLVSAPGAGKTALLTHSLSRLPDLPVYVITGDMYTSYDADRIKLTGKKVIQINTGHAGHLNAEMVHYAINELHPKSGSILLIENVGNLVCPASFDLGENKKVVMWSVADGDDKPMKYPDMFLSAQMCIINKIDLLSHVDFNLEKARIQLKKLNPDLRIIELSATTNENLDEWLSWLIAHQPVMV